MIDTVLSQIAALKGASAAALKARWRELFDNEPPPYNRRFLESRLAYRIQELAYGGLSRETLDRLQAMARQYDGQSPTERKKRPPMRPLAGTKLIREWKGVEHCVTVRTTTSNISAGPTSRSHRSPIRSRAQNGMAGSFSA